MTGRTARRRVLRISLPGEGRPGGGTEQADLLAAEEPLGLRVDGQALTMTMRTPGDDLDLAAGFLVSEGIVRSAADITGIRICGAGGDHEEHRGHDGHHGRDGDGEGSGGADPAAGNVADVTLRPGLAVRPRAARSFLTTSACGVCGKESISDLEVALPYDVSADGAVVSPEVLAALPDRLRAAQKVFRRTGGLHAAGLFSTDGRLLVAREDVGRHNAVDKVTGWALRGGRLPLSGTVLLVSGRASFELVQKAAMAGIPVLAAVSAPSSLAADLAERSGLTLVGFLRGGSMNVYTGPHRINSTATASTAAAGGGARDGGAADYATTR